RPHDGRDDAGGGVDAADAVVQHVGDQDGAVGVDDDAGRTPDAGLRAEATVADAPPDDRADGDRAMGAAGNEERQAQDATQLHKSDLHGGSSYRAGRYATGPTARVVSRGTLDGEVTAHARATSAASAAAT